MNATRTILAVLGLSVCAFAAPGGAELVVLSVDPPQSGMAPVDTDVVIDFDQAISPATVTAAQNHFHVFGEQSGLVTGTLNIEDGGQRLRFDPDQDFFAGETVRVTVSRFVGTSGGVMVRPAGFCFDFRTQTAPAALDFAPVDGKFVRQSETEAVRIYGGLGADFDRDGFLDLALVNEDSNDCRMLFNRADGTGHFEDMTVAPAFVGTKPSPSQSADFDLDGHLDLVAANTGAADVGVLFGLADGTLAPAVTVTTDWVPRGVAVLDANGDGFPDIATSNLTDTNGTVAVVLNDGAGGFLAPTVFDAGISFEVAMDAADMNKDGISDLVVGGLNSQTVCVLLANGDGTFSFGGAQSAGGTVWRLVCGDLNGDGFPDVTTANGLSNTGAVLLNDGAGGLGAPAVFLSDVFTTYTELGDLDGDGDLDWVLSTFAGGTYRVYLNNGFGAFSLYTIFDAVDRAAGVVLMDFDNDQDLDLVTMDEFADIVTFLENQDAGEDLFCFGTAAVCPCGNAGYPGRGCDVAQETGGVNVAPSSFAPTGVGTGSVTLMGTGFPAMGNPAIIPIRSTVQSNGGKGTVFGDGLLCVGPPVVRLAAQFANAGSASLPINHGAMAGAGTFHYQLWFRNIPATFCDATAAFNLSNGVSLTWQ